MKHLVAFTDSRIQKVLKGELRFEVHFFRKRPEFLNKISVGDKVFIRKGSEVVAQFEIGKIILFETLDREDFEIIRRFDSSLMKADFEQLLAKNKIALIVRIEKLEQLITSPVEVPYNLRKEWIVLEE